MRDELHEGDRKLRMNATSASRRRKASEGEPAPAARNALAPQAVDEALAGEFAPLAPQRGSRRDLHVGAANADHSTRALDRPHAMPAAAEVGVAADGLLRSLSEQMQQLQRQQEQIRRLLERVQPSIALA